MGIMDTIFEGDSEKQVVERGKFIIDHGVMANRILIKIIKGSKQLEEIKRIESNVDKRVFEITNSITSGAIPPNLIDDMLAFMDAEEKIVDNIFNLARTVARYEVKDKRVNRYVKGSLLDLAGLIDHGLLTLWDMHKANTISDAGRIKRKIDQLEQKGDRIKDAMLDYAYKSGNTDYKSFYYIQDVAYLADDILDGCQDASGLMLSIFRSVLT